MAEYCDKKNPLIRDGTSQVQRLLDELHPSYVSVDERTMEDLLVFTRKYAEYVKYYDRDNDSGSTESWLVFFKDSIAVVIAMVANHDLAAVRDRYEELRGNIEERPDNAKYRELLRLILDIARQIDRWYVKAVEGLGLHRDLGIIMQSSLIEAVKKIISYDKGASALTGWTPPELDYEGFSSVWGLDQAAINDIASNSSIYKGATKKAKILSALDYIHPIFEMHYSALLKVVDAAPGYMKEALIEYPEHEAHVALFLAFLVLFKYARNDLNKMTARHLDFYYRDVLRIQERAEEPDHVHIIFELAKQTSAYAVKSGTELKAGKDKTGVEVVYKTDRELAVNKAQVAELKTLFIDREDIYRIYSAPVANSGDGKGGDFDSDVKKWKTLGESQRDPVSGIYRDEDERTMEFGEIGFAITSPVLFLSEGERRITVTLLSDHSLTQDDIFVDMFIIYLSGKKGWIEAKLDDENGINVEENTEIKLKVKLDISAAPVIAYNKEKLGGTFDTDYPVLKIILNNKTGTVYGYEKLKDLQITAVRLEVEADEVKTLVLQNDNGLLDAGKPFYPFGTSPTLESGFYIGSGEIFQKKLTYLKLTLDWKDVPDDNLGTHYTKLESGLNNESFKSKCKVLLNRTWVDLGDEQQLFDTDYATHNYYIEFSDIKLEVDYKMDVISNVLTEYKSDTERGFIKLQLTGPAIAFGHRKFREVYTKAVIAYAIDTGNDHIPKEPYTPQLNELKLKYKADETVDLESEDDVDKRTMKFYHVSAFGDKEVHKKLESFCYLLPQFRYQVDENTFEENNGELYIGISGLVPPQNLSLLFQMAEGSADPQEERQTVRWSYLASNNWESFDDDRILSDSTDDLTTSGIITFDIPKSATSGNTLMSADNHWLRASLPGKTGAVCETIDVIAQAVRASFENNGNDPAFLEESLPKETISKLQVKEAEIKGVSQPYASFGGRIKEQSSEYYRRVSERLRHKSRAINIWDYERLVLEQFPTIYKVKCINHTSTCSEMAPGSVMIVPISNVRNKNAVDLLKPSTSVNMLDEIKVYISKIMPPFVDLKVMNPCYEEIYVKFKVEFQKDRDRGLYSQKLNGDIKKFLSPWAYEEGADISFGGSVHGSYIINFIEEREYVDYITEFELYQIVEGVRSVESLEKAEATSARSILVSSAEHKIDPVT
jgi:hypothetical protein